ncbi:MULTISPECIES: transcriptional regulator [Haloferax]|uniref:Transcriptional regulator n=1 Tax=Haloferax marinum TaxID=2666143 RepID=A0A6A8GAV1_9EURY|nr:MULTISPECIES: transcriptional regulator [Haloferax]KAB1191151.1 transcriptional regulator [Haloferax sp. CBA1150]MRW98037.1 transcriptional regulator [Haloferax marinum]
MVTRLSTGIDVLDQLLLGGIPTGSLVAIVGAPASQSELFLYELAARRPTRYLTTERSQASVEAVLNARRHADSVNVVQVDLSDNASGVGSLVDTIPNETTLIVDPADALERLDHWSYVELLQRLKTRMVETDGVAVLHCLDGVNPPEERDTTLYHADVVFALSTRIDDDEIENRLAVPKFRGNRALNETIRLDMGERVVVDTSRNIS